ncbi:MAG: DUF4982 domain-containing protein [Fibrella sp.]|nr:DUF4982 domain-containing protein [Armatimonadota bacterium]
MKSIQFSRLSLLPFAVGTVLVGIAVGVSQLPAESLPGAAQQPPPGPPVASRVRQRFDDGWRFILDESAPAGLGKAVDNWQWKPAGEVKRGDNGVTTIPADIDSGDWQSAKIGQNVFGQGAGRYAWYRVELGGDNDIPAGLPRLLRFEAVDDNAVIFLNGKLLLLHSGWNEPFEVPLDDAWKTGGPNSLVVLVENTAGGGGIAGLVSMGTRRPETTPDAVKPDFNDAPWRKVHLPHDYVVEGTFDSGADTGHGSLPVTQGWYRKTFTLPTSYRGKSLWIDFDGIYRKSTVYLNGVKLGENPSGYIGSQYDITKAANFGGKNVLAVHVDPRQAEGWWYEGGGIYRHVWLNVTDPVHVAPWGTFVRSEVRGAEGATNPDADVRIETTIINDSATAQNGVVISRVIGPDRKTVATVRTEQVLPAGQSTVVNQSAAVATALLWSVESPRLYRVETTISRAGRVVDSSSTPFGIRTIRFDANKGFFLNGKSVKIKGTCNHQDHAGVGIAVPDSLQYWRIRKLKEMGSNAYRCSHNPPAPEILDACDKLGMLVMDEARHLGDTTLAKTPRGAKAEDLSELKALIRRDRNHPSVIMWSMANEEFALQGTDEGARLYEAMEKVTKSLDPTRPVTTAQNAGFGEGFTKVHDLQGFNYNIRVYDDLHKRFPELPMYGSETASAVSTRGEYINDKEKGYVSAYDVNAPPWGATAEAAWTPIAQREWRAGAFVWTGFDYKGEPTPYGWPCINSHFGILDIAGFPKDTFWYYQAWWGDKPVAHLLPHWNWAGKEGQEISVWCHSNAEQLELFLNNKSLGTKTMPRYGHLEWKVPYAPGTLEVRGTTGGKIVATDRVETTGAPVALRLKTTRKKLFADGEDMTLVEVSVVDAEGRVVPEVDNTVSFAVTGAGEIGGVGNGDPSSHEPDKASQRKAFHGLCMVLVRAGDKPGKIQLRATAPGLKPAVLPLETAKQGDAF